MHAKIGGYCCTATLEHNKHPTSDNGILNSTLERIFNDKMIDSTHHIYDEWGAEGAFGQRTHTHTQNDNNCLKN